MSLIGDVPSAFPVYEAPKFETCPESDRPRCHPALSSQNSTPDPGAPYEAPSSFAYYHENSFDDNSDDRKKTPYPTSGVARKCDKKCCKVGRNSGRFTSFVRAKMNFVDVSRIRPSTSTKMCMKTRLVGEDCKPLLIRGSDDLMFPINDDVTNEPMTSRRARKESGRCRRFLDGLARTFCLPLLG